MQQNNTNWFTPISYALMIIVGIVIGVFVKGDLSTRGLFTAKQDPILEMIEGAKKTGTDRIELYTEEFAKQYGLGNKNGIKPYVESAVLANEINHPYCAGWHLCAFLPVSF